MPIWTVPHLNAWWQTPLIFSAPYLHGGDDHPSVHDKLAQSCWALITVPAVDQEQATNVLELSDREVRSQRRLLTFLFQMDEKSFSLLLPSFNKQRIKQWLVVEFHLQTITLLLLYFRLYLSFNSNTTICRLDHTDIISSITWRKKAFITSLVWTMQREVGVRH